MQGCRAQRDPTSERRRLQAAALQQLAALRGAKAAARPRSDSDENCSLAANVRPACDAAPACPSERRAPRIPPPSAGARDSSSSSDEEEDRAAAEAPQARPPLRRLRRLGAPRAPAPAGQGGAAADALSRSLADLSVAGASSTRGTGAVSGGGAGSGGPSAGPPGSAGGGEPGVAPGAGPAAAPGDLVLGERAEFRLPGSVAGRLYSHQVRHP